MKVTVIGCSPAWPNPGGVQSGYLVEEPGRLLLDCGAGVLSRLRESEPWPRIDAIVLTHLHLDHWADIVAWILAAAYGPGSGQPRPQLWVPGVSLPELREHGQRLAFGSVLERAFDVHPYDDGLPFGTAGFRVAPFRVPHYTRAAFALRVSAASRVLAYSGDSAPSARLAQAAEAADLFLCEATLPDGIDEDPPRGHLSAREAIDTAAAAGARRLVLVHRADELPLPRGVECARDGDVYEL